MMERPQPPQLPNEVLKWMSQRHDSDSKRRDGEKERKHEKREEKIKRNISIDRIDSAD